MYYILESKLDGRTEPEELFKVDSLYEALDLLDMLRARRHKGDPRVQYLVRRELGECHLRSVGGGSDV